jgi:hypothetical protein
LDGAEWTLREKNSGSRLVIDTESRKKTRAFYFLIFLRTIGAGGQALINAPRWADQL